MGHWAHRGGIVVMIAGSHNPVIACSFLTRDTRGGQRRTLNKHDRVREGQDRVEELARRHTRVRASCHVTVRGHFGTVGTTVERTSNFYAMADYSAAAMRACGCEKLDRTLEGIEDVALPGHTHFERFIVIISAYVATGPHVTPR